MAAAFCNIVELMQKNITRIDVALSRVAPVEDLFIIIRAVRNWPDLVLFRFGLKKEVSVRFRTGKGIRIRDKEEFFRFMHESKDWALELARQSKETMRIRRRKIEISALGRHYSFYYDSPADLGNIAGLLIEQFLWQEYSWLDVKGRYVVDVGACIADSAFYFVAKGAKHVLAIEPVPVSYRAALRNIRLNRLGDKITLVNAAVSDRRGGIRIRSPGKVKSIINIDEVRSDSGARVEVLTLGDLVGEYGIRNGLLKIDTEGYEYKIILGSSNDTLRHFSRIEIEYHNGYLNLERKLREAGFRVRHTVPKYSGYDNIHNPDMCVGLLMASRIGPGGSMV